MLYSITGQRLGAYVYGTFLSEEGEIVESSSGFEYLEGMSVEDAFTVLSFMACQIWAVSGEEATVEAPVIELTIEDPYCEQ
jgi:hypothetical protein